MSSEGASYARSGGRGPPRSRQIFPRLLRLNPQRIATNPNLLIRLHDRTLVSRYLASGDQGWVSSFGRQPVTTLIVEHQRCMNAADFRIAFQRQIDSDGSRTAANRDFRFGDLNHGLSDALAPKFD